MLLSRVSRVGPARSRSARPLARRPTLRVSLASPARSRAMVREKSPPTTPERASRPTHVPQSPTPRVIVPAGDDGVPREASVMTPGERHAPPGTVTRERDDHKHALTMQYLEDQAVVDDDGYVPPSETASDEDERDARERALTRTFGYDDALSRGEGDGAEDYMLLAGMVRAGECVEAITRRKMGGLTTLRWQRVGPQGGVELIENARGERYVCQDVDVGCILRAVRYSDGNFDIASTRTPVVAMLADKQQSEGKRKEIVLPEVPLGPMSEAHALFLRGKALEAESYDVDVDEETSDEKAKEALKCYVLAAKDRYVPAYSSIGKIYELGIGVKCDYDQARGWYKEGVKEGCPICNNNLGSLEYLELGIGADRENAAEYFKVAAAKGNAAAMNNLAVCYEEGVGVPASFNEARNYYEQAVRGGVMSAFTALGYAEIVNGDLDDALDAFHASLESGNPDAAEGVALLSTLQISSQAAPSPMEQNIKHASAELLKMEIDQYANLSMKLYDVIMKSNSEVLKLQARRITQDIFG